MSVEILSRERGTVLQCNTCGAQLQTGQIVKGSIRVYAASIGWMRGMRPTPIIDPATKHLPFEERIKLPPNLRHDICPKCAPAERDAADARRRRGVEMRKRREEKRLERAAAATP